MQASLQKLGCAHAEQFFYHDLFVVPDALTPPLAVHWCAVIAGSRVSDAEFIRSKGVHGICVKYNPSIGKKKFVWLGAAFRTTYPGISKSHRCILWPQ